MHANAIRNGADVVRPSDVQRLHDEARRRFGEVHPCAMKTDFEECLTLQGDDLVLWFNTNDGSTHIVRQALSS